MADIVVTAECDCHAEELRFTYRGMEDPDDWSFCEAVLWQAGRWGNWANLWWRIKTAWSALRHGESQTYWVELKPSSLHKLGEELIEMSEVIRKDALAKKIHESCL